MVLLNVHFLIKKNVPHVFKRYNGNRLRLSELYLVNTMS
jgi:hypothetical protein